MMDLCSRCNNPSYVLNAQMTKAPFRKAPDAKGFTCSPCIREGRLVKSDPEDIKFDLKAWRKSKKLTQAQLAKVLKVDRSMVAKVEIGEKAIPAAWEPLISKM